MRLGQQLGLGLAEAHGLAAAALHLAHEEDPHAEDDQDRQPGDWRAAPPSSSRWPAPVPRRPAPLLRPARIPPSAKRRRNARPAHRATEPPPVRIQRDGRQMRRGYPHRPPCRRRCSGAPLPARNGDRGSTGPRSRKTRLQKDDRATPPAAAPAAAARTTYAPRKASPGRFPTSRARARAPAASPRFPSDRPACGRSGRARLAPRRRAAGNAPRGLPPAIRSKVSRLPSAGPHARCRARRTALRRAALRRRNRAAARDRRSPPEDVRHRPASKRRRAQGSEGRWNRCRRKGL
jgi:hypothetical protein